LTCVSVETVPELSGLLSYLELPAKTYASYKTMGGIQELIQTAIYLVHHWLPGQGYKIAHEPVIQIPLSNPTATPFDQNSYQVFIQILPK
jgi:DNA gyrase inhibitor GyrI